MDRSIIAICLLTLSAAILLVMDFATPAAKADNVVTGRDYQLVTLARVQQSGEAVYILDNRTGMLAVFTYDLGSRTLQPRDVALVANLFR